MRILLIHWKPEEASPFVALLKEAGFEPNIIAPNGTAGLQGATEFAKAILIDLSRLPMQGRAVAIELRKRAATRRVPIVFVGGASEKVAAIRELLPDASYTVWDEAAAVVRKAIRAVPNAPVVPDTMAGYSGTPLPRKLGIKEGSAVALLNPPDDFAAKLEPLPPNVRLGSRPKGADRVVLFITAMRDLQRHWQRTIDAVAIGATVWIAWPKKTSGVVSDVTENQVRAYGLERDWVDYKICAIDATWSGLAFAKRKAKKTTT